MSLQPQPTADPVPRAPARARSRARVGLALLVTIALGLASRSGHAATPEWIALNAGDALWTVCVYLGLALLWPRSPARRLFALALLISLSVELSQLSQVEWLRQLRRGMPGRLLLGSGWQWWDLARYALGALLALVLDRRALSRPPER